jgi:hypothetical protein
MSEVPLFSLGSGPALITAAVVTGQGHVWPSSQRRVLQKSIPAQIQQLILIIKNKLTDLCGS